MSAAAVAAFAIQLLEELPELIQAGVNISNYVGSGLDSLRVMRTEDRGPTEEEYEALRLSNAKAHAQFQALGASDPPNPPPDAPDAPKAQQRT